MHERTHPTSRHQTITLYLLIAAALAVCAFILNPFLPAIVGAITLAVVLERPYNWLAARIPNRNLCATAALCLVILAIILPGFFLGQEIVQQAMHAVSALHQSVTDGSFNAGLNNFLARHPSIDRQVQFLNGFFDLADALRSFASLLGRGALWLANHSFALLTQLVILLFILYFLFRDRAQALALARSLLPLHDDEAALLLARLDDTITATAIGRLAISAIQGLLAGLGYAIAGIPGAALWAFATAIAALIPSVGAALVWAPIAVYLGLSGHWAHAALLALWGGGIVSLIDNFLYPVLVGTRLRAHTVTLLLAILGGVAVFGLTGVILGPVVFTASATLLEIWRARAAEDAQS